MYATSSMFNKFQCMLGGSVEVRVKNIPYPIIEGQSHFRMPRGAHELGLNTPEIDCSSFQFKHYLQACTTSGRKLLILYAKQPMEDHMGPNSNKKSHMVWCLGEKK